jgi:hypothetical protein
MFDWLAAFPHRIGLARGTLIAVALAVLSACGGGGGGGSGAQSLLLDSPGSTEGTVGSPVSQLPVFRVVDSGGRAVSGVSVSFLVQQGGGSVSPAHVTTDASGRAQPQSWTLGTTAGPQGLTARLSSGIQRSHSVTANPGPPAQLEHASRAQQTGDVNTPVASTPSVRVLDGYGNRIAGVTVEFAVQGGGGSVTDASALTNSNGLASVGAWTLGPNPGPNLLRGSIAGVGSLEFTAEALELLELSIEAVQLNQASQRLEGDIELVAGRPGLLRVVVRANRSNEAKPDVRVRLFHDGSPIWERFIAAPGNGVPVNPNLDWEQTTWNIELTPGEVRPGLSVEAVVDPQEALDLSSRENTRFPRGEGQAAFTVRSLPPLKVLFIPIEATKHGATGQVFHSNVDFFLTAARQWLPVAEFEPAVRSTPFVTQADLTDSDDISQLLSDLQAVRITDGATDRYYHGIMPAVSNIAVAGIAYVPSSPGSSFRTAISYDRSDRTAETVAHELAHNLGRGHSPCGDADGMDPDYPHENARIGAPGYDILNQVVRSRSGVYDYMSYCRPYWTSDYTYEGIIDWRLADPLALDAEDGGGSLALRPDESVEHPAQGVLVWGRVSSEGVELNPTFSLDARPVLPDVAGPNVLRGTAADGRVLFEYSFAGTEVPHATDPGERHFAYFVPLGSRELESLHEIDVAGPSGRASRRAVPAVADGVDFAQQLAARLPGLSEMRRHGLRLQWDAEHHPVLMVRDRNSGQVISFARGGELQLSATAIEGLEPEIVFSNGIRSETAIPVSRQ